MSYEIKPSSVEHINLYSQLLSAVFPDSKKFTPEFLKWQYAENPLGNVVGTDAFFEGRLVAHHATIPAQYSIGGVSHRSLIALNNATDPAHQGKGLFTRLGNATFERARELGYTFVITSTNANSTPGYLSKFGFSKLTALDVRIGIGSVITAAPAEHTAYSEWPADYLSWRLKNPEGHYSMSGRSVLTETGIPMLKAVMTSDVGIASSGLNQGGSVFRMYIGSAKSHSVRGLFINLPDKFKPSPLNLLYKDLSGDLPMLRREDVHFGLMDFDAF
ncbi:MAG: GNAT family N-acetyltransferase [Bacteroidota bacterium]